MLPAIAQGNSALSLVYWFDYGGPDGMQVPLLAAKANPYERLMGIGVMTANLIIKGNLQGLQEYVANYGLDLHLYVIFPIKFNYLHYAIMFDQYEVFQWLLTQRIDTQWKSILGTPRQCALKFKREEFLELLDQMG